MQFECTIAMKIGSRKAKNTKLQIFNQIKA